MNISDFNDKIKTLDQEAMEVCQKKWDSIAKPLNSLGKLEKYIIQIAGITGSSQVELDKKGLVVMCADNGIVEEGVTQSGQEVTAIVSDNFMTGQTTAAVLCKATGADIIPVDIGVATDTHILNRKIAYGTKNFAKEPAMSRREAETALQTGIDLVKDLAEKGYKILATGEMGIGNTTTSSALACGLLNRPVEEMTGRGAGLSGKGLEKKKAVIQMALDRYLPQCKDAVDMLSCMGGFDIAGLAGVFIGGALHGIPIVIDGFISSVAALTAVNICPACKEYILASHASKEPATKLVLEALNKDPILYGDMCLGEGTGAVMLFPILDMACEVYHKMNTFEDIEIEAYQPLS